jgi:hypothetical protein
MLVYKILIKIINIADIESNILVNSFYDLLLYNIAFFIKEIKQEHSRKAQELINLIKIICNLYKVRFIYI